MGHYVVEFAGDALTLVHQGHARAEFTLVFESQCALLLLALAMNASIVLDKHPGMRGGRSELIHTINSQASPGVLPITVSEGQLVHLHIVDNSEEYHPTHMHGHVLSVIARNGHPIEAAQYTSTRC